jgi:transposase InsO family protein
MAKRVLEKGWRVVDVAHAAGVSRTTVYKWIRRFEEEGEQGLKDRSSRPHDSPSQTPQRRRDLVLKLRRSRLTGRAIASRLGMPRSTVSRILRAARLSRARDLDPPEPVIRYERESPGELVHLDIKKLGRFQKPGHRVTGDRTGQSNHRGVGWEYVHVAIDDASRMAYAEVLQDEKGTTCTGFLERAAVFFADHGIRIQRVMTDNGSGYRSKLFKAAVRGLGARQLYTRPYRPQTNGKAERFIQTLLREWAYVRSYRSSAYRRRALRPWLRRYNHRRPHGSLDGRPPSSRVL